MFNILKARLIQGYRTGKFPYQPPVLPERFLGRPVIDEENARRKSVPNWQKTVRQMPFPVPAKNCVWIWASAFSAANVRIDPAAASPSPKNMPRQPSPEKI